MSRSDPPAADAAPAGKQVVSPRRTRLLLNWKLWLALLFTSLCLIAAALCMPVYRRMQAFDYLDAHEIEYELTDDNAWMTERFGRWGRGFRRVRKIIASRITDESAILHIAEFQEVKELDCWGTIPLSESSIKALTSLTRLESLMVGQANFTDEILARWFSHRPPLRRLRLLLSPIGHNGLRELSRLPALEQLTFYGTTLTDADLCDLETMPNLNSLTLLGGRIGRHGGEWIGRMPALRYLFVDGSDLSTDAWSQITAYTQLETLVIEDCTITAEALQQFSPNSSVIDLQIKRSALDDAGLQYIGLMHQLQSLSLKNCVGITDAGIQHLAGLHLLENLDLTGCTGLSDACVSHLEGMPALRRVSLPPEAVSFSSIESLRKIPSLEDVGTGNRLPSEEYLEIIREEW